MKAVIIDDEFWTRSSIRNLADWERFGIDQIEEAEDGLAGLGVIQAIQPEIVITDMKMRCLDGVELLRTLTEQYPFIRKIVVSGYDDFAYTKQAIASRVDEYILKPISGGELNKALEKAVRELRSSQGLYTAGLLSKELLLVVGEYKRQIMQGFLELRTDAVQERFEKLELFLYGQAPLDPGTSNSLYKQFMQLLNEQAARMETEISAVLPGRADSFFVTDHTEVGRWIEMLADSYRAVMEQLIQQRKNKNRLDIETVRQFIDRSFAAPISLESVAQQFFVSKEHLSRMFKQETGSTVLDYIIEKRMEEAQRLLRDPQVSIKYVAEAVGYSDLTYFYRLFKKVTGSTPANARQ